MNIDISLHILLFFEAWPVTWQGALKFWGSKVMTDATLAPYLVETAFLAPPVKAFVKAGFGGIGILKLGPDELTRPQPPPSPPPPSPPPTAGASPPPSPEIDPGHRKPACERQHHEARRCNLLVRIANVTCQLVLRFKRRLLRAFCHYTLLF